MFKVLLKKANVLKEFLGHYVPAPVKNEVKLMKKGMNSIINRYDNNYYNSYMVSKLQGKNIYTAAGNSCFTTLKNMRIKKEEVPAVAGLVAGALPIPASSAIGYALARVATCNKAVAMYHTGGSAVKSAYATFGHILNI